MKSEALEQYYIAERPRLIKLFTFRTGGSEAAAEDIVQEAFARALKYLDNWNNTEPFGKWFSKILKNALFDYLAEERNYGTVDKEDEEEEGYDCPAFNDQMRREINEVIDTKSLVQIEVLRLYFNKGYAAKDVAAITDHSYAMCHQIIQRFKRELIEMYK